MLIQFFTPLYPFILTFWIAQTHAFVICNQTLPLSRTAVDGIIALRYDDKSDNVVFPKRIKPLSGFGHGGNKLVDPRFDDVDDLPYFPPDGLASCSFNPVALIWLLPMGRLDSPFAGSFREYHFSELFLASEVPHRWVMDSPKGKQQHITIFLLAMRLF